MAILVLIGIILLLYLIYCLCGWFGVVIVIIGTIFTIMLNKDKDNKVEKKDNNMTYEDIYICKKVNDIGFKKKGDK